MKPFLFVTILLLSVSTAYAQIQDSAVPKMIVLPWFVERFQLSAGGFYVINNTNIRVSLANSSGTEIDMEKDLDLNREIGTFLADFQWQISRRSHVTLNYFGVNRSSDHILKKDIIFEDNNYDSGASVHSFFNTTIFQFSYGYAILSKPTYEAGLFIGTHIVKTNTGISLNGGNGGINTQNDFGFTAPLPDLGVWGAWALSNRFAVAINASYFSLTVDNKYGRLLAYNLNFTYKLLEQLKLTLGYAGLDFKVDIVKNNVTGNFKWGYNGPALGASFTFGKKSWTH